MSSPMDREDAGWPARIFAAARQQRWLAAASAVVVGIGAGAVVRGRGARGRRAPADELSPAAVLVDVPGWRAGRLLDDDVTPWGAVADAIDVGSAEHARRRYRSSDGLVLEVRAAVAPSLPGRPPGLVVDRSEQHDRPRLRLAPPPRQAFDGELAAEALGPAHGWHDGRTVVLVRPVATKDTIISSVSISSVGADEHDGDDAPSVTLLERLTRLLVERGPRAATAHPRLGLLAALAGAVGIGVAAGRSRGRPAAGAAVAAGFGAVASAGLWEAGAVVVHHRDGRRTTHGLAPRDAGVAVASGAVGGAALAGGVLALRRVLGLVAGT